jgi:hypothetical protein
MAIMADHEEGAHTYMRAQMTKPGIKKIVTLVRRCHRAGMFERAPVRLGGGEIVENFQACDSAPLARHAACRRYRRARWVEGDVHSVCPHKAFAAGGWADAVKLTNNYQ